MSASQQVPSSINPFMLAVADVDLDGKLDIANTDASGQSVSIRKNKSTVGTIAFAAAPYLTTATQGNSADVADIDLDGLPDLITTTSAGTYIFLNQGAGIFSSFSTVTTGGTPRASVARDLDGDGKPDLLVADFGSNQISLKRNASTVGVVSFLAGVTSSTGTQPTDIIAADLDGDGKLDILTADKGSTRASLFRNLSTLGALSCAGAVTFTVGTNPTSVYASDIDGDGKLDVITADSGSNWISVGRNTSTVGAISVAAAVTFATGTTPTNAQAMDLDGDGKPDLFSANSGSNTISLFRNTSTIGAISFAAAVTLSGAPYSSWVTAKDMNGDGVPDLVLSNTQSNTIYVYINNSTVGSFNFYSPTIILANSQPNRVIAADLNGDGANDLIFPAFFTGGNISTLLSQ